MPNTFQRLCIMKNAIYVGFVGGTKCVFCDKRFTYTHIDDSEMQRICHTVIVIDYPFLQCVQLKEENQF